MSKPLPPRDPRQVSASPTLPAVPRPSGGDRPFDVRDLYAGPAEGEAGASSPDATGGRPLDEKLRQAYFWMVNHAIIAPYYDLEFEERTPPTFRFGGVGTEVRLPTAPSYSSFVLLPLLNFAIRKRCLFIGGPGRGKTASAILMGVLAGYSTAELHRAIQHGQPQMTIADLLGNPLPKDLLNASSTEEIRIAWRKWLSMRVKIVDEYNRIPTRTQSALLTLMADGYAEVLDQTMESPESAWYLTANDDMGGGTYQVIEALKDRIDVVVKAFNFNPRHLGDLLDRVERGVRPEEIAPPEVVFTAAELDEIHRQVLAVPVPAPVRRRLEFFAAQFDFCDLASPELEYKSKDTIRLAGRTVSSVCSAECGRDKVRSLCSQTENGLSVRALMTIFGFVKALAWFRGRSEAGVDDVRCVVPWVLHEKLVQNPTGPFFDETGNGVLRLDKVAWLRRAFDLACEEYVRLDLDRDDPVAREAEELDRGLDGVTEAEVKRRIARVETLVARLAKGTKLYAHVQNDVLQLKSIHQRYSNYLRWLVWRG